jgi:hypothetical protein
MRAQIISKRKVNELGEGAEVAAEVAEVSDATAVEESTALSRAAINGVIPD